MGMFLPICFLFSPWNISKLLTHLLTTDLLPGPKWIKYCLVRIPSRELTYPAKKRHFEDDFPFPVWWDMYPFPGGYSLCFLPKIMIPQNGWFRMEHPIKMDDLGGKPTIFGNTHLCNLLVSTQPTTCWKNMWKTLKPTLRPRPGQHLAKDTATENIVGAETSRIFVVGCFFPGERRRGQTNRSFGGLISSAWFLWYRVLFLHVKLHGDVKKELFFSKETKRSSKVKQFDDNFRGFPYFETHPSQWFGIMGKTTSRFGGGGSWVFVNAQWFPRIWESFHVLTCLSWNVLPADVCCDEHLCVKMKTYMNTFPPQKNSEYKQTPEKNKKTPCDSMQVYVLPSK